MNKNIANIVLLSLLVISNIAWFVLDLEPRETIVEGTQLELEVRQRDSVIREMSGLIKHQLSENSKDDIANSLMKSYSDELIEIDEDHIFIGASLKLKFENEKLVEVYW
ncbi:MAG: hypothetical protein ABW168_04315 [Sedimenticola sp.]